MKPFQRRILSWYKKNKRDLPWRKTTNPYRILVSEIMLQQTQVDRVIPYYLKFIKKFPDLETLAKADKKLVLQHWSGLGYNNRVLRLQQLTQILIKNKKSIPQTAEELLQLPGIGAYTANAVLAFAFNKEVPVLDTNIRRVLMHELTLPEHIDIKKLKKIAQSYILKGKSRLWHNALMDYGALVLTAKKTGIAPLSKQSAFKGSDREVRGFIIKTLLKEKRISINKIKKSFPEKNILSIAKKMEKENLIEIKKQNITIA